MSNPTEAPRQQNRPSQSAPQSPVPAKPVEKPQLTSAALAALEAQKAGKPLPRPFVMPEVALGEIVMYQDGFYNRHGNGVPAIVTEIGPRAIELSLFGKESQNIRILGGAVRHKDDPEVARLAQVNSTSEEQEGFGVWYREDWMLTPTQKRRMKLLLDIYEGELDEYGKSGTINGKSVKMPEA